MKTVEVTPRQIAAAKLQLALDKADHRTSDPRVKRIAEAKPTQPAHPAKAARPQS